MSLGPSFWRILTLGLVILAVTSAKATNRPEVPNTDNHRDMPQAIIADDFASAPPTPTRSLGRSAATVDSRGSLVAVTWRDWQSNSSIGRTVDINPPGSNLPAVQFSYMYKASPQAEDRAMWGWAAYEAVTGTFVPPGGGPVVQCYGSMIPPTSCPDATGLYPKIAIDAQGRAYLGGHERPDMAGDSSFSQIHVSRDDLSTLGAFGGSYDGSIMDPAVREQGSIESGTATFWPAMDISEFAGQTTIYLAAFENASGLFGAVKVFRKIGWSDANPDAAWELVFVDSSFYPVQDISCDRTSPKVAVAWTKYTSAGHLSLESLDSDVWFAESTDGSSGNWIRSNVTNYSGPGHRAWLEVSSLYDSQGKLHLVWNASATDGVELGSRRCRIFHWSQWNPTQIYSVYDAEWDPAQLDCFDRYTSMNVAKVSVAECNNRLFVVFTSFNDPATGYADDCCALSPNPYGANGEIFATSSSDLQGRAWDLPRNLSSSYTPACEDGTCADDRLLGTSRYGMNESDYATNNWSGAFTYAMDGGTPGTEFLQVWYQTDRFPGGGSLQTPDGPLTPNDMRWIRLACNPAPYCGVTASPPGVFTFLEYEGQGSYTVTLSNHCSVAVPVVGASIVDSFDTWLTISDLPASIPAGDTASIRLHVNANLSIKGPDIKYGSVIVDFGPAVDRVSIYVDARFSSCCVGQRGDINIDGHIDLTDLSCLIGSILQVYPLGSCRCEEAKNVNGVGFGFDLSDLSLLIAYLTASPRPTLPDCPVYY